MKNGLNTTDHSAKLVAKGLAVLGWIALVVFCFVEVMGFASYVIPVITVSMYRLFEQIQTADASIHANVSLYTVIFPSLFLIFVTSLLHYRMILFLIKKGTKWMMGVLHS